MCPDWERLHCRSSLTSMIGYFTQITQLQSKVWSNADRAMELEEYSDPMSMITILITTLKTNKHFYHKKFREVSKHSITINYVKFHVFSSTTSHKFFFILKKSWRAQLSFGWVKTNSIEREQILTKQLFTKKI